MPPPPAMARSPIPLTVEAPLVFGACTDIGCVRRENQDRWGAFPSERPCLFVVADGMGGHADGGVASHLAVAALAEGFRQEGEALVDRLREAVAAANAAVWREANRGGAPRRMGTTCTALAVEGGRAALAHVGDSRAYRLAGDALEQLSPDHTVAAELEASGVLTEAEARRHPQRHALTRALGVGAEVEVYIRDLGPATPGDCYLLCSDGLAPVPPDEVARIVANAGPQEAAEQLVARANALGGPDNITALILRIGA